MIRLVGIYFNFIVKRLLFVIFWVFILLLFFVFRPNDILYVNLNKYLNLSYLVSELDLWFYIVHVLIIVFIFLIVVETIYAFFYSWFKQFTETRKKIVVAHLQTEIFAYLSDDMNDVKQNDYVWRLTKFLYSSQMLRFFVDGLREVVLLTKGKVHNRCLSLFVRVQVTKLIRIYIYSPYVKHRAYALRAVGEFQLKEYEWFLRKYLNSRNSIFRSESLQSFLEINRSTDLSFLLERKAVLSVWDYNILIKYGKNLASINYDALLRSERPDLLLVALKFIQINEMYNYKPQVIMLLKSESQEVQEEAYITYSLFLETENDVRTLIYKYGSFTHKTQMAILGVIVNAKFTKEIYDFLKWLIDTGSMHEKTKALEAFLNYDIKTFLQYKNNNDVLIASAYKQVTDFNLMF